MGETGGTQDDLTGASGPNRRALLKGAVAAGVGAAAWSAPDIKTLGFTPAYAQTCTIPPTTAEFDGGGINNGSACGVAAEANQDPSGSQNGITFAANGTCLDGHDTTVTWSGALAGAACTITVFVQPPGGGQNPPMPCGNVSVGPIVLDVNGSANIPMPQLDDGDCPNGQVGIRISCSNDPDDCL